DGGGYICYSPVGSLADGTEAVTASQVSGPDTYGYGLVFREVSKGNYYVLVIDANSKWAFYKSVGNHLTALQPFTVNAAITGGLNTKNTIAVTMTGSTFDCYVNGQQMGTIHDGTYAEGQWGLSASPGVNVVFTNYLAKV
ncbi:MAG TPA: LamG-like jellyroll fold domain-containing protein, partial [Ktedonobacterales bacterium]